MKTRLVRGFTTVLWLLLAGGQLAAGKDITVYDGQGMNREDNETEPNTYTGPRWDLEGVLLNGRQLTLLGTYDFVNGARLHGDPHQPLQSSGDIFIRTSSASGWDYVIHPDWSSSAGYYAVYANPLSSRLVPVDGIPASNPWNYNPAPADAKVDEGSFSVAQLPAGNGFQDWIHTSEPYWDGGENIHRAVTFDLSFLPDATTFIAHFTIYCGNDSIQGEGSVPDGGTTAGLLGAACAAFVLLPWLRRARPSLNHH